MVQAGWKGRLFLDVPAAAMASIVCILVLAERAVRPKVHVELAAPRGSLNRATFISTLASAGCWH